MATDGKKRNKDLKNRERFSSSMDKKLKELFMQLSVDSRIPQSKLLDEAISDLLKKHNVDIK